MNKFETKFIRPVWDNIYVTRHAIEQYQSRVIDKFNYAKLENIVRRLKNVLINGRRSDRDPTLTMELEPWLNLVKWNHNGRPVSVWMDEKRLCCLVVRDNEDPEKLVVLTCFKAVEKL